MSKIKLDDRVENAISAFFESQPDHSRFELTYTGSDAALIADDTTFSEKAGKWTGILREIFLFGPGAFFLFYMTLTVIDLYPEAGITFGEVFWVLASAFLIYAGTGSIQKPKNLAVPATVITMAVAVALISSLFPSKEQSNIYYGYSIYLFPNVLIAGKLMQGWVSDKK
jgi:hypothetical protein